MIIKEKISIKTYWLIIKQNYIIINQKKKWIGYIYKLG